MQEEEEIHTVEEKVGGTGENHAREIAEGSFPAVDGSSAQETPAADEQRAKTKGEMATPSSMGSRRFGLQNTIVNSFQSSKPVTFTYCYKYPDRGY
jgi:hypothetical protein